VPENYVHRIGRTARAGREGEAIALCAPEEADLLRQIQKLMKIDVPVASGSNPLPQGDEGGGRRSGSPRRRGKGPMGAPPAANESALAQSRRRRPRRHRAA
jgi:ATP-dependent RNA helicase RhlE